MAKKKECKSFTLEFNKDSPNPTIKIFCPFYEDITTMKIDIKWLKDAIQRREYISIGTLISIVSLIISVIYLVLRIG